MQAVKKNRGSQPAIGSELWTELQQQERAGKSLREIADWLQAAHQITVSEPTVSRVLAKIRATAPPAPAPPPALEPATDDDELRIMRKHFRQQVYAPGQAMRDQRDAAKLLLAIMAEQRERRTQTPPAPQPLPTAPVTAAQPAAPAMTPEEEAAWVARFSPGSN